MERKARSGRRGFLVLAALALLIQILVPKGFMVSAASAAPAIVVCTGHGPMAAIPAHGEPNKAPKSNSDIPCGSALHDLSAASSPPVLTLEAVARLVLVMARPPAAFAPERRLAAPPPPSHAPPAAQA